MGRAPAVRLCGPHAGPRDRGAAALGTGRTTGAGAHPLARPVRRRPGVPRGRRGAGDRDAGGGGAGGVAARRGPPPPAHRRRRPHRPGHPRRRPPRRMPGRGRRPRLTRLMRDRRLTRDRRRPRTVRAAISPR
ncbi:hypothetical protein SBRY_40379 [Actinacidiphila bryophytorum]|uniref:Uncharacterized protein n=1 Tax=Actinacidiphila bryophytorum TaxID=1436133 RepID=A0A9W4H2T9_9ACTN|nr:hypothetical protein SBRY_40379 [Actinacidiphila bryophytorum]